MIRWCAYCQRLIGEAPPLIDFRISHGICERCTPVLEGDQPLAPDALAAAAFYRELFRAAARGDQATCADLARRAADRFGYAEVLLGLVQPALVEIGERWQRGEVTAADEHRFTAWCEAMLTVMPRPPAPPDPLDLVLVLAPGNRHQLGPRLAEQVLITRGVRALAVTPDLPLADVAGLLARHRAGWVGFSCALPHHVDAALAEIDRLVQDGYRGRAMIGGQAVRRSPDGWRDRGVALCATVDDACACLRP